jgi:hypothetical protein
MAVKSKVQLAADIAASTFTAPQQVILDDMVDSYDDLNQPLTISVMEAETPEDETTVRSVKSKRAVPALKKLDGR